MSKQTERYTDRDILIRVADSSEALLQHFSNGEFVNKLKEGIKEQTKEIIKEIVVVQISTEQTKGTMNWIRYTAFGIISALVCVDLALIGLYARQIIMGK